MRFLTASRSTVLHSISLNCIAAVMLMTVYASPVFAQDMVQFNETEIKEKWGQLLLCQRIYKMKEVRPRLYSFDTEQCDKAGKLMTRVLTAYTPAEQQTLKFEAEKHARALSRNTSEPYHSVPACRQYCGELANTYDQQTDR